MSSSMAMSKLKIVASWKPPISARVPTQIAFSNFLCFPSEMPLRTDEKSGKVGRTFPDFQFYRLKGEITQKGRLFLHLESLELL